MKSRLYSFLKRYNLRTDKSKPTYSIELPTGFLMHQRKTTTLIQSLLLATLLSNIFIVSACSAESSNTPALSNRSTPTETYELGLAYYEGNSVPEDV